MNGPAEGPCFVDAHNHLQEVSTSQNAQVVIAGSGVVRCVANGTSPDDWEPVLDIARRTPGVVAALGLHPWSIDGVRTDWLDLLRDQMTVHEDATVGEIGLDKSHRSPGYEFQRQVFCDQLSLAAELDRAVSVHCVRWWGRLAEELAEGTVPAKGLLLHCFTGPKELVSSFADMGAYFSLGQRCLLDPEILRTIPPDRLLFETDANGANGLTPADVIPAYRTAAEILGEPLPGLARQIAANFERLFGAPGGWRP